MSAASDTPLIERLRRADPSAFVEVYAAEKACVYGFVLRLARDPSIAADLFQNVWLKLAQHAAQLREDSNLRAWLLTVARREYLSFRRAQALDLSRVLLFGLATGEPHAGSAEASELLDALARLSDADRELLLLSAGSGLDADAVAVALGISHAALRQRLVRARRRLQLLLDAEAGLPDSGGSAAVEGRR